MTTKVEIVQEYFARIDKGDFASELFTKSFQFYYPKFGTGVGAEEFAELASGIMSSIQRSTHHLDEFEFVESESRVVVEGTTEGADGHGVGWHGGRTRGGRFCSVFAFNADGLIERMRIYSDPDPTGEDTARFRWPGRAPANW